MSMLHCASPTKNYFVKVGFKSYAEYHDSDEYICSAGLIEKRQHLKYVGAAVILELSWFLNVNENIGIVEYPWSVIQCIASRNIKMIVH